MRDSETILDIGSEDLNREAFAMPVLVNKMKDIISDVQKYVEANRLAYKKKQNNRSKKKTVKRRFEVGDVVYLLNPFKMKRKSYEGPFRVCKVCSPHTIEISDGMRIKKVSVARVKLVKKSNRFLQKKANKMQGHKTTQVLKPYWLRSTSS